jgi:hypothetical protein
MTPSLTLRPSQNVIIRSTSSCERNAVFGRWLDIRPAYWLYRLSIFLEERLCSSPANHNISCVHTEKTLLKVYIKVLKCLNFIHDFHDAHYKRRHNAKEAPVLSPKEFNAFT